MRSADLTKWTRVATFLSPGEDYRDPKLLAREDKLLVYFYTRYRTAESFGTRPWVSHSDDGVTWSEIEPVYKENYVFWRPKKLGEYFYVAAHKHRPLQAGDFVNVNLLRTTDGFSWSEVSEIYHTNLQETTKVQVHETSIDFYGPDRLVVVIRDGMEDFRATMAFSGSPFKAFEYKTLDTTLQGPAAVTVDGVTYISGRRRRGMENEGKTVLYSWSGDDLKEEMILPSGGDTSYGAFLPLGEDKLAMTYYSSHEEGQNAIYLATFSLESD